MYPFHQDFPGAVSPLNQMMQRYYNPFDARNPNSPNGFYANQVNPMVNVPGSTFGPKPDYGEFDPTGARWFRPGIDDPLNLGKGIQRPYGAGMHTNEGMWAQPGNLQGTYWEGQNVGVPQSAPPQNIAPPQNVGAPAPQPPAPAPPPPPPAPPPRPQSPNVGAPRPPRRETNPNPRPNVGARRETNPGGDAWLWSPGFERGSGDTWTGGPPASGGRMWPGGTPPWEFDETIGGPNPNFGPPQASLPVMGDDGSRWQTPNVGAPKTPPNVGAPGFRAVPSVEWQPGHSGWRDAPGGGRHFVGPDGGPSGYEGNGTGFGPNKTPPKTPGFVPNVPSFSSGAPQAGYRNRPDLQRGYEEMSRRQQRNVGAQQPPSGQQQITRPRMFRSIF